MTKDELLAICADAVPVTRSMAKRLALALVAVYDAAEADTASEGPAFRLGWQTHRRCTIAKLEEVSLYADR
jgi:hypothetical protein